MYKGYKNLWRCEVYLISQSWMFNWKISFSVVNLVILDQFRKEKSSILSSFLVHPFPTVRVLFIYFGFILKGFCELFGGQIRADTAEYLYVFLQSKDIGFETDEIEEIILDTEWYVSFFFHFPSLWSKTILWTRRSASDMGMVREAANNIVHLFDSLGN